MTVLFVGARDWDHPDWQGTYFPEDLPADWRLSYYANEFSTVLVDVARVLGPDGPDWEADTPESFRVVVRDDGASDVDAVARCLGGRLGAWLLPHRNTQPGRRQALTAFAPVCSVDEAGGECVVCRVDAGQVLHPAVLRESLETLMDYANGVSVAYLFLEGEPPRMDNLQQAKTVAELLGY